MSLHLVLLTMACCSLAAAVAGGPLAGLTADTRRARQMAVLVSTALVVGNAACLLPGTPAWYSVLLVALTAAGLVWMIVSQLAAVRAGGGAGRTATPAVPHRAAHRQHAVPAAPTTPRLTVVSTTPAERLADAPALPKPHLALLPGGAEPRRPSVVEATLVEPADTDWDADVRWDDGLQWNDAVLEELRVERRIVTRRELDTMGARGTRSQSVAVARNIRTLAPESGRRRAAGSAFDARVHGASGAILRARLRSMYDDRPSSGPRLGTTRA